MRIRVESTPVDTWCVASVYKQSSLPYLPHCSCILTPVQINMAAKKIWLTAEISFRVCHRLLPNCLITPWLHFFPVLGTIKQVRCFLNNAEYDFFPG